MVLLGNQAIKEQTGDRSNIVLPGWRDGRGPVATHDKGMYALRTEAGCWTRQGRARDRTGRTMATVAVRSPGTSLTFCREWRARRIRTRRDEAHYVRGRD